MTDKETAGVVTSASRDKLILDLVETLPDHWSLMRVTRLGGVTWRVYNRHREVVAEHDDLETALNLALT